MQLNVLSKLVLGSIIMLKLLNVSVETNHAGDTRRNHLVLQK